MRYTLVGGFCEGFVGIDGKDVRPVIVEGNVACNGVVGVGVVGEGGYVWIGEVLGEKLREEV